MRDLGSLLQDDVFPSLREIILDDNPLRSLEQLGPCTKLVALKCSRTKINDLNLLGQSVISSAGAGVAGAGVAGAGVVQNNRLEGFGRRGSFVEKRPAEVIGVVVGQGYTGGATTFEDGGGSMQGIKQSAQLQILELKQNGKSFLLVWIWFPRRCAFVIFKTRVLIENSPLPPPPPASRHLRTRAARNDVLVSGQVPPISEFGGQRYCCSWAGVAQTGSATGTDPGPQSAPYGGRG